MESLQYATTIHIYMCGNRDVIGLSMKNDKNETIAYLEYPPEDYLVFIRNLNNAVNKKLKDKGDRACDYELPEYEVHN